MATKKYLELQEFSDADLIAELEGSEASYEKARFDHSVKGLDNPLELRDMRRDIARIQTEVRKRELAQMTPDEIAKRSKIRERRRRK
ncbi:MAG: 50S ribosomal protein L29 [Saprospiraceae bacterium]|nr:50S ribosomal protein L29 [Saprospiraceae bacterium]